MKPRSRTLKRDTLKALERATLLDAATRARNTIGNRYEDRQWDALLGCIAAITEYIAHAQSQAGGKRRR